MAWAVCAVCLPSSVCIDVLVIDDGGYRTPSDVTAGARGRPRRTRKPESAIGRVYQTRERFRTRLVYKATAVLRRWAKPAASASGCGGHARSSSTREWASIRWRGVLAAQTLRCTARPRQRSPSVSTPVSPLIGFASSSGVEHRTPNGDNR